VSVKIPKKTLDIIDKVVRKKLRKTARKHRNTNLAQKSKLMFGSKLKYNTLSVKSREDDMLEETRENLFFTTPEKQTQVETGPATASHR
jgi:hypothetical protein